MQLARVLLAEEALSKDVDAAEALTGHAAQEVAELPAMQTQMAPRPLKSLSKLLEMVRGTILQQLQPKP
jgi:hypothetical protein